MISQSVDQFRIPTTKISELNTLNERKSAAKRVAFWCGLEIPADISAEELFRMIREQVDSLPGNPDNKRKYKVCFESVVAVHCACIPLHACHSSLRTCCSLCVRMPFCARACRSLCTKPSELSCLNSINYFKSLLFPCSSKKCTISLGSLAQCSCIC